MGSFTTEDIRLAQQVQAKYGIPASVTLAQYALESGYGTSNLAKTNNNYFGMRAGSKGWQTHASKADSFDRYGQLMSKPLYANKTAGATNVNQYVNAIAETYAPSSDGNNNYAGKILEIISANNLTQYDTVFGGAGVSVAGTSTGSSGSLGNIGSEILGWVIKGLAILGVAALAFIFLMTAFNAKIPTKKNIAKAVTGKVIEKAVEK